MPYLMFQIPKNETPFELYYHPDVKEIEDVRVNGKEFDADFLFTPTPDWIKNGKDFMDLHDVLLHVADKVYQDEFANY